MTSEDRSPSTTKRVITWQEFEADIRSLALKLNEWMDSEEGQRFQAIGAIPRGGMVPAVCLSHLLNLPIVSDPVNIKRLLIVDDIADTGLTMRRWFGGNEFDKFAVLYTKPWSNPQPDFFVSETEDWIVFPWEMK